MKLALEPRLVARELAAAYCGVSANHFGAHVEPHVAPLAIGSRRLWDVRDLDAWIDLHKGAPAAGDKWRLV